MKKSSIHDGVSFHHYSPDFTIAIKINASHMMGEKNRGDLIQSPLMSFTSVELKMG